MPRVVRDARHSHLIVNHGGVSLGTAMSMLTAATDSPAELKADNGRRRTALMSVAIRYGVAMLAVGLSLLIKLFLQQYMDMGMEQEAPFMLSLAAVMVSGWY